MRGPLRRSWWRHQSGTFSAFLSLCEGNSPVTGEFPSQSPETQSFDVFFDVRLNKRLSKQSWGMWFKTPSRSWCHSNEPRQQYEDCIRFSFTYCDGRASDKIYSAVTAAHYPGPCPLGGVATDSFPTQPDIAYYWYTSTKWKAFLSNRIRYSFQYLALYLQVKYLKLIDFILHISWELHLIVICNTWFINSVYL